MTDEQRKRLKEAARLGVSLVDSRDIAAVMEEVDQLKAALARRTELTKPAALVVDKSGCEAFEDIHDALIWYQENYPTEPWTVPMNLYRVDRWTWHATSKKEV